MFVHMCVNVTFYENPFWLNSLKTFHKIGFIKQKSQSILLLQSIILSLGFTIDYPSKSIILYLTYTIDYTLQSITISLASQSIILLNRLSFPFLLQSIIKHNRLCELLHLSRMQRAWLPLVPTLTLYKPPCFLRKTLFVPPHLF